MNVQNGKSRKRAVLLLADGSEYEGFSFGCEGETVGEVVFETGMVGYQEALTDPSYYGQIVVQTFPLTGDYGVNAFDAESDHAFLKGFIAREWCEVPSNFRCEGDIDAYMKKLGVVGIYGVDTRAITRKLRDEGVLGGMIAAAPIADKEAALAKIRAYQITDSVAAVSRKETEAFGEGDGLHVAVLDLGGKKSLVDGLLSRGCRVTVFPYNTPAEKLRAANPDGILLTDGPGDPAETPALIENVKEILNLSIPTFGVGLGHQLMAIARGAKTSRMKYGHRGANQPVVCRTSLMDKLQGRTFVTTQNHGYVVETESVTPEVGEVSFANANDGTCEGINYSGIPAMSVQFYPFMWAGPLESDFLYAIFVEMMERKETTCR